MLISHEVPKHLLGFSLNFNDYDYFLVHQLEIPEYREFFEVSKSLKRRQILDNSLYELKESFDPDKFAEYIKELQPTEYLIPDAFNDFEKNIEMFDSWMQKYDDLKGVKIATVHGKNVEEFQKAYDHFDKFDVKIAFNFAESLYMNYGKGSSKEVQNASGRYNIINSIKINPNKKHHLLGCSHWAEFKHYKDFGWIETIDTSNPIMAAFEGLRYPINHKPKLAVDDCQDIKLTKKIYNDIEFNVNAFRANLGIPSNFKIDFN
jgi:hypothetical protein